MRLECLTLDDQHADCFVEVVEQFLFFCHLVNLMQLRPNWSLEDGQLQSRTVGMQTTEKLCLQWNDFKENIGSTFAELRDGKDFADVTLACEDGEQIEAHRIVLASSSPVFKNLLVKNKHPHPLIYMKGVKFDQLSAIVDFIYFGETRTFEENLETFLALAEELKLKGLTSAGVEMNEHIMNMKTSPKSKKKQRTSQTVLHPRLTEQYQVEYVDRKPTLLEEPIPSLKEAVAVELGQLDQQIESMTSVTDRTEPTRGGKIFACKVCGKEGSRKDVGRHIESKHITGVVHNCDICGKTAR